MFASRYFPDRYYPVRYFPPVGAAAVAMEIFANKIYEVYIQKGGNTWEHTRIVFTGSNDGDVS